MGRKIQPLKMDVGYWPTGPVVTNPDDGYNFVIVEYDGRGTHISRGDAARLRSCIEQAERRGVMINAFITGSHIYGTPTNE